MPPVSPVSCFPCHISAWKFVLAYIYIHDYNFTWGGGVGEYSKNLIAAEKCIVE